MISVFQTNFPPQITPIVDQKQQVTTPWMAFLRALYLRTGESTGLANQVNLTATGSLTDDWNLTTGNVILPALTGGQSVLVQDSGGTTTIAPPAGATIDGAVNYNLPAGKMQIFWFFSATQIFSTQLG